MYQIDPEELPNGEAVRALYFNNKSQEAKIISKKGIQTLVDYYARKGGVLTPNILIRSNVNYLSSYLDVLYWIAMRESNISEATFYAKHLELTKLYDEGGFNKLMEPLKTQIDCRKNKIFKVHISCRWTDTTTLYKNWQHLFENQSLNFIGFQSDKYSIRYILTTSVTDADYFVVIWGSPIKFTADQLKRTIFFRTEPLIPNKICLGGPEIKTEPLSFLKFFDYHDKRYPNCAENWLQEKSSNLLKELRTRDCDTTPNVVKQNRISAIVSNKYVDPGHKFRIDLLKAIVKDEKLSGFVDIYGFDNYHGFSDNIYKGPLATYDKRDGLLPYKYTITAENHSIPGYLTEKIVDGILAETLVFYWGCPNLEQILDCSRVLECPFIRLPTKNNDPQTPDIDECIKLINTAIDEDWWESRIFQIRVAKKRILTKLMMQHRIAEVIAEDLNRQILGEDAINLKRLATSGNFPIILYQGARFNELSKMVSQETDNKTQLMLSSHSNSDLHFELICGTSNGVPFMQEFSKAPSKSLHYTIGNSRFSMCQPFEYPHNQLCGPPRMFVINLVIREDRLKKFRDNFTTKVLAYNNKTFEESITVFDAVDGKLLKTKGLYENEYAEEVKYLFRDNDFCSRPGVIGCALSHITLWRALVEDHNETFGYLIFEDDVDFADAYEWKLYSMLLQVTFEWDILFLGHLVCYEYQTNHRVDGPLPIWEKLSDYTEPRRTSWVGTASYIISKRGAMKLLQYIEAKGVQHGIDYLIQLRSVDLLRAYVARPMLNFADYESPLNPNKNIDSDVQK